MNEQKLHNQRILVTRESAQAKEFSREIALRGGIPLEVPLLKINCTAYNEEAPIWDRLDSYEWIFFTSANGVRCFFKQLEEHGYENSVLKTHYIAAVGTKTEKALLEFEYEADFIPTVFDADTLAKEFFRQYSDYSGDFLLIRGNKSLELLPHEFRKKNIAFDSLVVYETGEALEMEETLKFILKANHLQFLTFTSPSSIDVFKKLQGLEYIDLTIPVACIGTTTEKHAKTVGFINTFVPDPFTIEGMIVAMEQYIEEKGSVE